MALTRQGLSYPSIDTFSDNYLPVNALRMGEKNYVDTSDLDSG